MTATKHESAFVYVTCPDKQVAKTIATEIVKAKLAACGNILPNMTSVYRWDGRIMTGDEAVLILKTQQHLADKVVERVVAMHPYEVPAAVVLPVTSGHGDFLRWISEETAESDASS